MDESEAKEEVARDFNSSNYTINFQLMKWLKEMDEQRHVNFSRKTVAVSDTGVQTDDYSAPCCQMLNKASPIVTTVSTQTVQKISIPSSDVDFSRGVISCSNSCCCIDCGMSINCLIHSR